MIQAFLGMGAWVGGWVGVVMCFVVVAAFVA